MLRKVSGGSKIKIPSGGGIGSTWYTSGAEVPTDIHTRDPQVTSLLNKNDVDRVSTPDEIIDNARLQKINKARFTYASKIHELQKTLKDEQMAKDEIIKLCSNMDDGRHEEHGGLLQSKNYYEKKIVRISANIKKLSKKLESYQLKARELEDSNSDYTRLSDNSAPDKSESKKESNILSENVLNYEQKLSTLPISSRIGNDELTLRHRHHSAEAIFSLGNDQLYLQGDRQSDQTYKNLAKLEALRKMQHKITDDILDLQQKFSDNQIVFRNVFDELKMRIDQIEDQINDLTEIHQYEIFNIKQELSSLEEKIEYQLEERTSDLHELLESCQTKISKLELQQQQQQQLLTMESFDNTTFPLLIVKLINVVLAFFAVIFVLINAIVTLFRPFFQSRLRSIISLVSLTGCLIMWRTWHLIDLYPSQSESI